MGTGKLSARAVATIKEPGRHSDGGNLYLSVSKTGSRSWIFMWSRDGRQREMGLGPAGDVTLAAARALALEARRQMLEGLDPLAEKVRVRSVPTFGEAADAHIAAKKPGWSNPKHIQQWVNTLGGLSPAFRNLRVNRIETSDVLAVLEPIWTKTPESASRIRGRIEVVLDAAKAKGQRTGENPAAWKANLDHLLPARQVLSRGHQKALPFAEVPAFMAKLRANEYISSQALQFTILSASRTIEVIGAGFTEFDMAGRLWTVPRERMKGRKVHRVPLSEYALGIVEYLEAFYGDGVVFLNRDLDAGLSDMAMLELVRGMDAKATVHGFRSSFRDWAAETTDFSNEVVEMCLAHTIPSKVEAAYRRGELLAKRREVMDAWATFCLSAPDLEQPDGQ